MSDKTNTQSQADLLAQIAALQAENEALRRPQRKDLSWKVSEKGAVSVYGINSRFPVTLYGDSLARYAQALPEILAFAVANAGKLSAKDRGPDGKTVSVTEGPNHEAMVEALRKASERFPAK